jgi:fusion and transport protein UGO1
MIRRIRATPSEGLPALWKGQLVATAHALLSNLLQPHIHSAIYTAVPASGATLPLDFPLTALPHPGVPLAIQVASHAITQFILSPLEMVRTRLIAMPHAHPSTPSSLTILRRAVADEGGLSGLYLAANLLIPTLLENTIRPLLTLSIPLIIERQFGISPDLAPITYSIADLGLNITALLFTLPIETVRRRLQLQGRNPDRKIRSVVRLRDRPYTGVVEAMWRIVTEETAAPRKRRMSTRDEGGIFSGLAQLYRGVSRYPHLIPRTRTDNPVRHGRHDAYHRLWPRPRQRWPRRAGGTRLWLEGNLGLHAFMYTMHLSINISINISIGIKQSSIDF